MNLTNLINQLNSLQEQYEFTDSQLVSKIGVDIASLHLLHEGKSLEPYVLDKFVQFVAKLSQNIYPTKLLDQMERLLRLTFKEQAITVIGSVSGAGKTLAAERFSNENHYAIYLYVPEIITARYLLTLISQKLQLPWMSLSLQQMYESIINSLSYEPKLLVLDEADRLSKKMFEIMRDLWHDGKGNVGVAFVGDENLMNKIKRESSLRENLIRLMRRVKYVEIMDPLHTDDIRMAIKHEFGKKHQIDDVMIKEIYRRYSKLGGFGSILNLIDKIKKLAARSGDTPNNEMCEESMRRLKL